MQQACVCTALNKMKVACLQLGQGIHTNTQCFQTLDICRVAQFVVFHNKPRILPLFEDKPRALWVKSGFCPKSRFQPDYRCSSWPMGKAKQKQKKTEKSDLIGSDLIFHIWFLRGKCRVRMGAPCWPQRVIYPWPTHVSRVTTSDLLCQTPGLPPNII